jgi:hypothetical protein
MINRSTVTKFAAAGLATAMAVALASPSYARNGRNAAAVGGFVAGAVVGSAIANSHPYYRSGYAYGPGYAYDYAYEPGYSAYAYSPAPSYQSYGRDYEVSKDEGGQPIYRSQLSPYCTFGDKLSERC